MLDCLFRESKFDVDLVLRLSENSVTVWTNVDQSGFAVARTQNRQRFSQISFAARTENAGRVDFHFPLISRMAVSICPDFSTLNPSAFGPKVPENSGSSKSCRKELNNIYEIFKIPIWYRPIWAELQAIVIEIPMNNVVQPA